MLGLSFYISLLVTSIDKIVTVETNWGRNSDGSYDKRRFSEEDFSFSQVSRSNEVTAQLWRLADLQIQS